ncbi:hypothetical protein [Streptomyces sp. C10-9-1]
MEKERPEGFAYPDLFMRAATAGLLDLDPWWALDDATLAARSAGLSQRYPTRNLIPFSRRQDNDEVACWDLDLGGVSVVEDYSPPGQEQISHFEEFSQWLAAALNDFIEYEE